MSDQTGMDDQKRLRSPALEELRDAVNEMKSGKAPGMDRPLVQCLMKGSMAVLEWLVN